MGSSSATLTGLPIDDVARQLLAALYGTFEPPSSGALRLVEHFLLLLVVFWASSTMVRFTARLAVL